MRNHYARDGKIRGVHLFPTRGIDAGKLQPLIRNNIEWIVLVPFIYQQNIHDPELDRSWRRRGNRRSNRDSSITAVVEQARKAGIHAIIKPHIWLRSIGDGEWRAEIEMKSEADWQQWSAAYREMTLRYAALSEDLELPLFCIGTELHLLAKKHPEYWRQLIRDVRQVYSGKITYGANWHREYEDITFWDELDYIGIQAYFPLLEKNSSDIRELKQGWRKHLRDLENFHKKWKKPILFTEIGYKSTEDAAVRPWEWASSSSNILKKVSTETQANCYEAFFQTIWQEEWLSGALIWQWRARHDRAGGPDNINFTPQNKPAENIIASWYGRVIR